MNRMLLTALIVGSVGLAGTAQAAGDAAAGKAKATAAPCATGPMAREPRWVPSWRERIPPSSSRR